MIAPYFSTTAMESYFNPRRHDSRPKTVAECIIPGKTGLDLKKYQDFVSYQADKSRRRITALVGASYEEEKKQTKNSKISCRGRQDGAQTTFDSDCGELPLKKTQLNGPAEKQKLVLMISHQ